MPRGQGEILSSSFIFGPRDSRPDQSMIEEELASNQTLGDCPTCEGGGLNPDNSACLGCDGEGVVLYKLERGDFTRVGNCKGCGGGKLFDQREGCGMCKGSGVYISGENKYSNRN